MINLRFKNTKSKRSLNSISSNWVLISFLIGFFYITQSFAQDSLFYPAVNYSTNFCPSSVFASDLDGDGDNDLAVADWNPSTVDIFRNDGYGHFQLTNRLFIGEYFYPLSIYGCDLDGDGDTDLITANERGGSVSIFLNNGNALFQPPITHTVGTYANSVFGCDLDGDGDKDLAVAKFAANSVSILINNGDGTFQLPINNYMVGSYPYAVFGCDLDEDGDNDLVTANSNSNGISFLRNNGNGTFEAAVNYTGAYCPYSLFACDLDGDEDYDVVTANYNCSVSIFKNTGSGDFYTPVNYSVAGSANSVFGSDFDGDGDIDLVTANEQSNNISILINNGNGTFQGTINYNVEGTHRSVFAMDLDSDGDKDIATTNYYSGSISILLNRTIRIGIENGAAELPSQYHLSQNYPNPFNAQTKIAYSLTKPGQVSIDIYDILGRKVTRIAEGDKEPGNHEIIWDASDVVSGIYFYKLTAGDYHESKQMLLLK